MTSEIENEYSGIAEDDAREAGKDTEVFQEYVVREAAGDVEQVVWVVAKVEAADDDGRGVETNVAWLRNVMAVCDFIIVNMINEIAGLSAAKLVD